MSVVDSVFQYRTLLGMCELGAGLEFDDIDALTGLESRFRPGEDDLQAHEGRRFHREPVELIALLRGRDINDRVAVADLGPGGLLIAGAPYTSEGDILEIVIEEADRSYRFKARVQWVGDDGDDYLVGLAFVGLPVRLTYGPASEAPSESAIHRIAA